MPSIDVAMVRSLRGGLWETVVDSVARSLAAEVVKRDLAADASDKVSEIKQAFSSWDGCMAHIYCKWPAIALMIVGGLILLSLLICIVRCTCLGMSCCCSCCYCLKCCGNCCGCCDAPGGKPRKHLDEPYNPQQSGYGGYRQEAPMAVNVPAPAPVPAFAPAASHGPPQYAEFDVSKHDADALPAMPSWETANAKKIVLEEEVEMDDLPPKKEPAPQQNLAMNSPRYGGPQQQQQQRRPQQQQGPMGRNDPYNRQQSSSPGYMNSYGQQPAGPYGGHDQGYAVHDQGYAAQDQGYAAEAQAYGAQGQGYGAHNQSYGVHEQNYGAHDQGYQTHDLGYNGDRAYDVHEQGYGGHDQAYGGHDQAYGSHDQGLNGHQQGYDAHDTNYTGHDQAYNSHAADGYGANQPYDHAVPAANLRMSPGHQSPTSSQNGFGIPRQMTPGPAHMPTAPHELDGNASPDPYGADPHMRKSPGPDLNQRTSPAPPNDFAIAPQNKPVPFRTYTPAPPKPLQGLQDPPQSPITNNSGFDFSSGYSRPQQQEGPIYDRRPSESHEREDTEGYPGYKPYSPSPQNWSGV